MSYERVVVTGLGVLCPVGQDMDSTWQSLIHGQSGIDYITLFDAESFVTRFAGEVKGFQPTDHIIRRQAQHMDRFSQLAVAASQQAITQAGLKITADNETNIGVIIGSGLGGLATLSDQINLINERGPQRVSPFLVPMLAPDMAAAAVSIMFGAKGPSLSTSSSCSSGSDAIGAAFEIIRRGEAQAIITGGSEAAVTPIGIAAFNAIRALSQRNDAPQRASRPFDSEHDGFVLSEGAGIMVVENHDFARRRGANILAEIIGYGISSDAYHITHPAPDGQGMTRAMRRALDKAELQPTDIDYINAHGTSTPLNDRMETKAINTVFGEAAGKIPVSSTKSMMGHLIGAAGAVEAAVCIMALRGGLLPPTINLNQPDPECNLDYVPHQSRPANIETALSNSFGFGGHNSVLIFRRYPEAP